MTVPLLWWKIPVPPGLARVMSILLDSHEPQGPAGTQNPGQGWSSVTGRRVWANDMSMGSNSQGNRKSKSAWEKPV